MARTKRVARIPKSFALGGQRFTIVQQPFNVHPEDADIFAVCSPDWNTITLLAPFFTLPVARQDQTLWHEIVHALLHAKGDERWNDEGYVESLSVLIHQIVSTMKYST